MYDLKSSVDSLIYAEYNWWGQSPPDSTKIDGDVDWKPYLTSPPGEKAGGGGGRHAVLAQRTRPRTGGASRATAKNQNPDSTGIAGEYNEMGTIYLLQLMYDEAIEAFQYVLTNFPDCRESNYALVHLIHCYREAGYRAEIVPYLESLALNCAQLELRSLALFMSISQLCMDSEYHQALNRCQMLLAEECNEEMEKSLRLRVGIIYRYGLNDNEAAIAAFQDFIARYPDDLLSSLAEVELEILGLLQGPKGDPEVAVAKSQASLPKTFALYQNYPNPFNTQTCIQYDLPRDAQVSLKIYNVLGQRVKTLANDLHRASRYKIVWNGRNSQGNEVSSAIYFVRFEAGKYAITRKMVLLR